MIQIFYRKNTKTSGPYLSPKYAVKCVPKQESVGNRSRFTGGAESRRGVWERGGASSGRVVLTRPPLFRVSLVTNVENDPVISPDRSRVRVPRQAQNHLKKNSWNYSEHTGRRLYIIFGADVAAGMIDGRAADPVGGETWSRSTTSSVWYDTRSKQPDESAPGRRQEKD